MTPCLGMFSPSLQGNPRVKVMEKIIVVMEKIIVVMPGPSKVGNIMAKKTLNIAQEAIILHTFGL